MYFSDKSVVDVHSHNHHDTPISIAATPPQMIKQTAFDEMNRHLHQIATKPVISNNRRRYQLGAVPTTGGGLDDSDRLLLSDLYYNASSVFEFGLGESSHIAAYVGVQRYAGVDNDSTWVAKARDGVVLNHASHFRFSFSDTGRNGMYGRPADETLQKIPYAYQSAPLNNELDAFDVYLVDGTE